MFDLYLKDGTQKNPTQTFKDRGMSVAVSMARRLGLRKLAVPTAGNAGGALALYAAAAGMQVYICMPEETPAGNKHECLAIGGVEVEMVPGTIAEAGKRVAEKVESERYFSVATLKEPGWRVEGKKTMGLELAEQFHWTLPEVIVYPTGGGTGIVGMWKAFKELAELGMLRSDMPKMVAVQAHACAPIYEAYKSHAADTTLVCEPGRTVASGLRVPAGVGHFLVLRATYESAGAAITVSEEAIKRALNELMKGYGLFPAPEGAATFAALDLLVEREIIPPGHRVLLFNTGSGRKYFNELRNLFSTR